MSRTVPMVWSITLNQAQLNIEVVALNRDGTLMGQQPTDTGLIDFGNGSYGWYGNVIVFSDEFNYLGFLVVRPAGRSDILAARALQPIDTLNINLGDGSIVAAGVNGDVLGRVLGSDFGNGWVGPGVAEVAGRVLGQDLSLFYDPLPIEGVGVHLENALTALIESKLALLTSGTRVVTQATVNQQDLTFYRGSDYTLADGAAPSWQAVFSPAELQSIAIKLHDTTLGTGVITSSTDAQSGYVAVTAEDLELLALGDHPWQLEITTVDGDVLPPPYRGVIKVKPGP